MARDGTRQFPRDRNRLFSLPIHESDDAAINKRCRASASELGRPNKKMNAIIGQRAVDDLAMSRGHGRPVLALPLKGDAIDEMIDIFVAGGEVAFLEGDQKDHILAD